MELLVNSTDWLPSQLVLHPISEGLVSVLLQPIVEEHHTLRSFWSSDRSSEPASLSVSFIHARTAAACAIVPASVPYCSNKLASVRAGQPLIATPPAGATELTTTLAAGVSDAATAALDAAKAKAMA